MTQHDGELPPIPGRILMGLIVGPDAEVLRGDLVEAHRARLASEGDAVRVRLAFVTDVLKSVLWWWWSRLLRWPARAGTIGDVRRRGVIMRAISSELRQVWRGLIRRPGYSSIVILTLGLGIGATTTIYSVVDAMLLRALPYPDADRLVMIGNTIPGQEQAPERDSLFQLEQVSHPNVTDLRGQVPGLELATTLERGAWPRLNETTGMTEMIPLAEVTGDFFTIFGVKPLLGRFLGAGDAWSRGTQSWQGVITYQAWQRRFGGDPNVVGKKLDGTNTFGAITVVGVLPRDFYQPAALMGSDVDFFIYLDLSNRRYQGRGDRYGRAVGRMKPGVTLEQLRGQLTAAQAGLARDYPDANILPNGQPLGLGANSLLDATVGNAARPMLIFFGASVLLLVLAGTNAANLLIVRGLERDGEIALRRALGAGRWRVAGQLIGESVSLAAIAGVVGLGIATAGMAAFRRFGPTSLPRLQEVGVNLRIVVAGIVLSLLVGAVIGLVPAMRSSANLLTSLRATLGGLSQRRTRFRSGLAAAQLALALVLGIGASLLFRSFVRIRTHDLGFKPANLVSFTFFSKSERPWENWDRAMDAVRAVPGVAAVTMASNLPLQSSSWRVRVARADEAGSVAAAGIPGFAIGPSYFRVLGVPLLDGRDFDTTDQPTSPRVVIVNQAFVRASFRDRSPVGARVRLVPEASDRPSPELEIVGVVGDVVQARVEDGVSPAIYVPYTQRSLPGQVVVATTRETGEVGHDIRRAMEGLSPVPIANLTTMERLISVTQTTPRFHVLLIGAFAVAAVVLSAVGLYGTLAYTVRSRTKELGIRMAMGAGRGTIFKLVLLQGGMVLAAGLAVGVLGALGVTRLLRGFLYQVSPVDPLAFATAVVVIALAVIVASLRPASRAANVDPLTSIRAD